MGLLDVAAGHVLTLAPVVQARLRPSAPLPGEVFETDVADPKVRGIRLTGRLRRGHDRAPLLVLAHGLAGSIDSPYMPRLARQAQALGFGTLMLNLRGADRRGDDIYHAGLTADLEAALASQALRDYAHIAVLGCSLGGHMALRWGLAPSDPRVRAVGSLCAPLDLKQAARDLDSPARALYRHHLLGGLKEIYSQVHLRQRMTRDLAQIRAITTMRAWDELTVAPRFGFDSAEHYWHEVQVAPQLPQLALPTRIVISNHDPVVLARPLRRFLSHVPRHVQVDWVAGGHLGFKRESQAEINLLRWLYARTTA